MNGKNYENTILVGDPSHPLHLSLMQETQRRNHRVFLIVLYTMECCEIFAKRTEDNSFISCRCVYVYAYIPLSACRMRQDHCPPEPAPAGARARGGTAGQC